MGHNGDTTPATAEEPPARVASYRVQLNCGFTFQDAASITGYLAELGVSHLYCSPYLQAVPGSTHGYDVVDHSRLNADLGAEAGYSRLVAALREVHLGQVEDIVPNHMALGRANTWWWDVLENGPSSIYARYFDIDWDPPDRKMIAKILVPILGDHLGRVLEDGDIALARQGAEVVVTYGDAELPLSPRSLDGFLGGVAREIGSAELGSMAKELGELPHALLTDPEDMARRHRDSRRLRAELLALIELRPEVGSAIDDQLVRVSASPDEMEELLARQNFRLAYWRLRSEDLSYRRFFDIDTLAGLRVEDPAVFQATHRVMLDLVRRGVVDGLRVDHVDGLRDPLGYLRRLEEGTGGAYVVVEKILGDGEELPSGWPVAGTTGYEFLNRINGLFVDPAAEPDMTDAYAELTGEEGEYSDLVRSCKVHVMQQELAPEIERLTTLLAEVAFGHRRNRDHTHRDLRHALRELIAALPVYRTYAQPGVPASPSDRTVITEAVDTVLRTRPEVDPELAGFLGELLLMEHPGEQEVDFALRCGQVSSAVMAKGVEDTAFYRYHRLVSLNEVGGDPTRFGRPPDEVHEAMIRAADVHPQAMLCLSTHDTKRSADVRARINVLSELPATWVEAVRRWCGRNRGHWPGELADPNVEYLLYQTLVGAWPIDPERLWSYMQKAIREAKVRTSWAEPREDYEQAVESLVRGCLGDAEFVADLEGFLATYRIVERGRVNSLAQTALLLTCPGVPDLYQGDELWDLSLVDPDNRRRVDYARRQDVLAVAGAGGAPDVAADEVGISKMWMILRILHLRAAHPESFGPGSTYEPLAVEGPRAGNVFAFARGAGAGGSRVVVVVPRLAGVATEGASHGRAGHGEAGPGGAAGPALGEEGDGWEGTTVILGEGENEWADQLGPRSYSSGRVAVGSLLSDFPVAVLVAR